MGTVNDEIYGIQSELKQIINELDAVSIILKSNNSGIGTEKCAKLLQQQCNKCDRAIGALRNIDTTKFREGFGPNANS